MYRLLSGSLRQLPSRFSNVNSEIIYFKVRDRPYLINIHLNGFCKSCSILQSAKSNPTVINEKPTRKRGKNKKNYYELLVVPNSMKNQQVITSLPDAKLPELEIEEEEISKTEDLELIPKEVNSLQSEDGEEALVTNAGSEDMDEKVCYEVAVKTQGCYIEMWANLKNPNRGWNALVFHNSRATRLKNKKYPIIKDIKVYNALLKGFASQGDVHRLTDVIQMIKHENIKMNAQSYIAILECFGRANARDHYLKYIRIYAKEAITNGYTYDMLLNNGTFLNDERAVVLSAIRKCDPNYIPKYKVPTLQYNNNLVNHLNHEDQLRLPEVKETDEPGLFTKEFLKSKVDQQLKLETHGYLEIKSVENTNEVTDDVLKSREALADMYKNWEEAALAAFKRELMCLMAGKRRALNDEPYLRCIPMKDFVTIIIDEAKRLAVGSETYSPTLNYLQKDVGKKVYARYLILRKQKTGVLDKVLKIHNKYCDFYASQHDELDVLPHSEENVNSRQVWQWAEYDVKHEGATLSMDHRGWNMNIMETIGKILYSIILQDLKIDVNIMRANNKEPTYMPAFYKIFRREKFVVMEEIKPHPTLARLFRASMPETLTFPANEVPMVCPPVPWISVHTGGYLVAPSEMVRLMPQATLQKKRMHEAGVQQLYPSLDALNQLAAVPWKVNTGILDVILEVFHKGGSAKLDVPEPSTSLPPPPPTTNDMDKAEKYKMFRKKLQYLRKKGEMHSLWCDCLYRLSLANHFREEIFWLPHNMDFRGRVYPIPPHLNHLGSDLARSMLIFAEARPLGPDGLNWLKLHLVNLTGLKKRDSVEDRLKYADEIIDDIMDSADFPLTGRKWWAESDEPWQTLACCMEIARALRSGDPENYRSHFPVHQDGSCNGLQHYAALGRDSAGAYSVNLCPSEVPQDVYSAVVALVEEQRKKDAANGIEIAKLLEGFVKRKVIKQTIMTTVYGVTRFGARLQIARQLNDIDEFPKTSVWVASSYLTGRTFESLRSMFQSTREIQDWFTDCARYISAVSGRHVEWITPMGLPVVQPYFKYNSLSKSLIYKRYHMDQFEKPNVMKQKNAFPPNFIHSLDSSHMMLTSLHCERAGITFVSVHDCYWTHPSTVHIMNKICREQFVALHKQPILEDLSMFLSEKYSYSPDELEDDGSKVDLAKRKLNRIVRQLPKTGDFDINQVLNSVYFFS